jgi:sirohydrochlorin cobaltochelatase
VTEAVLVIGHGSRNPDGNREFLQFVERMKKQLPNRIVEACFLELATPLIQAGIDVCVAKGATRITCVPVILFAAGHVKVEIPEQLDIARRRHPEIAIHYGGPIGIHHKIIDILQERLSETEIDLGEQDEETAILLVGRGSSDPDANGDFCKMARLLWEKSPVSILETAFMGVTQPTLEQGLDRCIRLGAERILILPYFLFTGVLINRMADLVEKYQTRYPRRRFTMAQYFGLHDGLIDVLVERAHEAVAGRAAMNCDLCQYRLSARHHHHHHHRHHIDEGEAHHQSGGKKQHAI